MAGGQGEISSPNFLSWCFFYKKKAPLPHLQPQQEILVVVPSHCPPCCWVGVTIPGVSPGVWGCWGSSAGCWAGGLRVQEGAQCVWSWERQEGTCLEPPLPGHCVPSEVCPCLVGTGMVQRERLCSAGFWFLVLVLSARVPAGLSVAKQPLGNGAGKLLGSPACPNPTVQVW